jgi:hypothetical protein
MLLANSLLLLAASTALAPLSEAEQQELVDAYVIHRVCQPFVNDEGQIYFRQLKYNAAKSNPAVNEFFNGVEQALLDTPILANPAKCRDQLPTAFQRLELFRRFVK